ncbi:MAG TPA: serine/threonine-protein kinase [Gemmatimonadaceae bacterium]|nr:serine/threonine-protein kinase [Gemmatimonadaceae bacterium]
MSSGLIADRYEITRTLGKGAFGQTFLARDTQGDRMVAVKLLDARGAPDWKAYELFEREAAVLRSLRHHGVPEIYDSLRAPWNGGDAAFLVMEYVEGTSLAQMIDAGTHVEPNQLMHLVLELLAILEYLHGRVPPILHRDIKPSNIIVRPNGYPAIVDFGAVRRVFLSADESGSTIAGTYGYMPYEQYMGQASPSSDLYAVGATVLHLLTGRPPKDFMNSEGRIEVPEELPGDARLRGVVARMLRPSPAERFASARAAREALLAAPATAVATRASGTLSTRIDGRAVSPRRAAAAPVLPRAPRELTGDTKQLYNRLAHSMWRWMEPTAKSNDFGLADLVSVTFFSLITAGILPMVFFMQAHNRKRLLRGMFRDGVPGVAVITAFADEDGGFSVKYAKVSYEFEADGQIHRDADTVIPAISNRWRVGDTVQILYLPEEGYDSVIVSTN